ncbi:DUF2989 domain-containing protein [Photobacterium sp. DNB23_23_1]
MRKATLKLTLLLASTVLLSGCFERHRSTDSLCQAEPQLCADTNLNDGQCRLQRVSLIWQRYDVQKDPTDKNKFKELQYTYDYQKCLEYAARIEPTELKERKTHRTQAMLSAYASIDRLNTELATSNDPEILYFRWSQGNKEALRKFLRLEGSSAMETPEMQLALATFYTSKDQEKTIGLLKRALELYARKPKIKPEILQGLATLSHQQGAREQAYLWAKVGEALAMPVAKQDKLNAFYPMSDERRNELNGQAEMIARALYDGDFNASMAE